MSAPVRLFISYSHKDKAWLERLQVVLSPLTRDKGFDLWDDTRIKPGQEWRQEIEQALKSADAAILLVSADFLASDFITNIELKMLLERRAEGMGFFWIPIAHSLYQRSPLKGIQSAWDPKKPLALLKTKAERDRVLVQLAEKIDIRAGEARGAADLGDDPNGIRTSPAEVSEAAGGEAENELSDTDRLLVALIDRRDQESPIQQRSRSPKGPTLFVVPGPEAQKPSLFLKRLKNHTCAGLSEELKKGNRTLIHGDIEWPSFPETMAGEKDAVDKRLKRVVEGFTARAIGEVDSVYGEALDAYATRAFKKICDTRSTTLHIFVLQLVDPKPSPGECKGFARFAGLWERFCTEHSPSNILIVFVVSASWAEFNAGHGAALAGLVHAEIAEIVEEMANIRYNDINTWLRDNRLSTRFNTDEIDKRARLLVPPERREGVQMSLLADEAARWLSQNRIKR